MSSVPPSLRAHQAGTVVVAAAEEVVVVAIAVVVADASLLAAEVRLNFYFSSTFFLIGLKAKFLIQSAKSVTTR